MDIQQTFDNNAANFDKSTVDAAINEGIARAGFWQYGAQFGGLTVPDAFWTTTVRFGGHEFEIHKPKGQQPGILSYRKV